jgi:hypothetical protein
MKTRIFFFALITIGLFACKNNSEKLSTDLVNNPNSADTTASSENMPQFQFETDLHDFGKVIEGEILTYSFKFKNSGKADLVIATASATCGCTVPTFSKEPIRPNEEGIVTVTFNTKGKMGFQHKTVTLVANTQPSNYVLNIKATVHSPENN